MFCVQTDGQRDQRSEDLIKYSSSLSGPRVDIFIRTIKNINEIQIEKYPFNRKIPFPNPSISQKPLRNLNIRLWREEGVGGWHSTH